MKERTEHEALMDDLVEEVRELFTKHGIAKYSEGCFVRLDYTVVPPQEAKQLMARIEEIASPLLLPYMTYTSLRDNHIYDVLRHAPKGKRNDIAEKLADRYGLNHASLRVMSYRKKPPPVCYRTPAKKV